MEYVDGSKKNPYVNGKYHDAGLGITGMGVMTEEARMVLRMVKKWHADCT